MPPTAIRSETIPQNSHRREFGLRERLRTATAAAHARLDLRLGALDLTALPDYRRFLEVSAAGVLPLETKLEQSGVAEIIPDWPQRSRRGALLDDLANIAGRVPAPPASITPESDVLDRGGMLGTLYVLEGSRLGAQVLLRRIKRSPDPLVAGTTAYLRHGSDRRLWPSFLEMLKAHGDALDDDSSAIAAARRAFATFDRPVTA